MAKFKNQPAGPLLDKPCILLPEPGFGSQFAWYVVLLLLGGLSSLSCFSTAFQLPLYTGALVVWGCVWALACTLLFLRGKHVFLLSLCGGILWAAALFFLFDDVAQAALRAANLVLQAYGAKLNLSLPILLVKPVNSAKTAFQGTLLGAFFIPPFFWCLASMLIWCRSALWSFMLTGLLLLPPMLISLLPSSSSLAALLLFWAVLLLAFPSLGQRHKLLESKNGFRASGIQGVRAATLWLLPAAALCMALVYAAFPLETYERPKTVSQIKDGLSNGFGLEAVFQGGTGNGGSNRVDLYSLGQREYTGKTVLKVQHQWKNAPAASDLLQKDYLKSFVGSVYTGGSWEPLAGEAAEKLEELTARQTPQTLFARLTQLLPNETDQCTSYALAVENLEANPRCVYLPYGLSDPPELLGQMGIQLEQDGAAKSSNWISGTRKYQLEAVGSPLLQGGGYSAQVYAGRIAEFLNRSGRDQDAATLFFSPKLINDPSIKQFDLWKTSQQLRQGMGAREEELALWTEDYNDFVYQYYTQLPDGLAETLQAYLETQGLSQVDPLYGHSGYIEGIRQLFEDQFTYSLSPGASPRDRDFVEYFLKESKTGYCVHFATAAAALLRAAGIPARYAEGYVAPCGEGTQWVSVPDRNAHAWVEIYAGGQGWIPIEVTPASPDAPATYSNARTPEGLDTPSPPPRPERPSQQGQTASSQAPSASSDAPSQPLEHSSSPQAGAGPAARKGASALWPIFLTAALFAALSAASLWLNRSLRRNALKRQLAQPDRNKAALCAYAHLLKLWEQARFLKPGEGPPPEWKKLALKAKFSQHTLTDEELRQLTGAAKELEEALDKNLSLPQRLRCRYLLGLF